MYDVCRYTIYTAWALLLLVWPVASFSSKRNARTHPAGSRVQQIVLVTLAFFLLFDPQFQVGPLAWRFVPAAPLSWISGVALTVAGIVICFWARFFLGNNWSANVTVKQDHELVRSGPYAIVRHPIYCGLLLAMFGTAVHSGHCAGLLGVLMALFSWKWKSVQEEAFMQDQFGEHYTVYRRQVKALIPFIW